MQNSPHDDFSHKEAKFHPHEHVQRKQYQYLYVRVVKAKGLLVEDVTDGCECYVEVWLGDYKGTTRPFTLSEKNPNPEWNQVIHMRICLEGGYHVLDESPHYSTALRPTAKQLWKKSIGILEFGILSAHGLTPMKIRDGRATTDAYCVAKYGTKWFRTEQ
ncbi:putative C2 domain-containing protein [Helianthus annuus]|nr:putative C2 domain-containing protein [Helianthus annuus]